MIETFIEGLFSGGCGEGIYFIICFLQPIILPTPELLTVSIGSSLFGSFNGFIIGFAGTMLGITVMYLMVNKFGEKLAKKLVREEYLNRYRDYIKKNEVLIMGMLFIIPILPDEVVCVGAGLGKVTKRTFFYVASLSKAATNLFFAYSVEMASIFSITKLEFIFIELVILVTFILIKYSKGLKNVKLEEM